MVHVINWEGREQFAEAVEQIHRLRKQVFIDFFKWNLTDQNGLEIDQFDTPDAYYLFDQDPDTGTVISSMRLLPTTRPHMMENLFSHMCAVDWPRGPHVFEVSRLLYNPILQAADDSVMLRARRRFALGLLEFCKLWGINELVFVTHAKFLARLVHYNWDMRPLGLPTLDGDQQVAAMRLSLHSDTLANLRAQFDHFEPVLQSCPPRPQKAA